MNIVIYFVVAFLGNKLLCDFCVDWYIAYTKDMPIKDRIPILIIMLLVVNILGWSWALKWNDLLL